MHHLKPQDLSEGNENEKELLNLAQAKDRAKLWGIAFMSKFVEVVDRLGALSGEYNSQKFHDLVEEMDNIEFRTGREVFM